MAFARCCQNGLTKGPASAGGRQDQVHAQPQRDLDATNRKLAILVEAIAGGLRNSVLRSRLSAAKAETSLVKARPSTIWPMHNLGIAYRQTVATLREKLATSSDAAALNAERGLIDRVVINPAPRG